MKRLTGWIVGIAFVGSLSACGEQASAPDPEVEVSPTHFDLVLSGGRVMDPGSGTDAILNVGISDGSITAISETPLVGDDVIDVSGLIVAPGFIDLHAHGQHTVGQQFQARDGVTTALEMEGGVYPVDTYLANREGRSIINYGGTVSHICIRKAVKNGSACPDLMASEDANIGDLVTGDDDSPFYEPASEADRAAIAARIEEGLKDGGLGVGFGIEYTPAAGRQEIYEIFRQAGEHGAPIFVHVRRRPIEVAPGMAIAVAQEVIANAAVTGAPLQIVHVTSTALGDAPTVIEMVEKAQARGIDITTEVYPYPAASTAIGSALFDEGWRAAFNIDYGDLQWTATGERLTEETFHKLRAEQPGGAVVIYVIPEDIVRYALAHPAVSVASDGMAWVTSGEHPRGAGTFSRVLGRYVRDEGVLDLMLAIKKMTLMPAERMQKFAPAFANKGRIRVGADADITVFDAASVIDKATFMEPMQYSDGIEHVMVGGTFVVRNGESVPDVFPGQAITGSAMAAN